MRRAVWLRGAVLAVAVAASGCAGNGEGLNATGRPEDPAAPNPAPTPAGPFPPTLAAIQQNVFTPICTTCHAGAQAPVGLRLDEANAFAALVNTNSVERPGTARVIPGNPDGSYLIAKIEGREGIVGGRMPLGGAPLPPETIAVIRQWIANGAQATVTASAATGPAALLAVSPAADEIVERPLGEIIVTSTTPLDAALLQGGVVTVTRSGHDGSFAEGNELMIDSLNVSVRSLDPTVLAVSKQQGEWLPDSYRLTIAGAGPTVAADRGGVPIDGDGDGQPGGDFVVHFEVGRSL